MWPGLAWRPGLGLLGTSTPYLAAVPLNVRAGPEAGALSVVTRTEGSSGGRERNGVSAEGRASLLLDLLEPLAIVT